MKITSNILTDFFRDMGWTFQRKAATIVSTAVYVCSSLIASASRGFSISQWCYRRIWSSCRLPISACLVPKPPISDMKAAYWIAAGSSDFPAVYSEIQRIFDEYSQWDHALSSLLLNGGTLQDILNASTQILKNPCFSWTISTTYWLR